MWILHKIFEDKRITISVLMVWLVVALVGFQSIDLFHTQFMTFGPSPETKLMTLTIDTWGKWSMVAITSFVSTCISDFTGDALIPWVTNCVQDYKAKYIPYSKITIYIILQLYAVYCNCASIFAISLMMSQIDFLMIRLAGDLLVNSFTTWKFLRHKIVDARLYELEGRGGSRAPCDASVMEMTSPLDEEAHPLQENGA
jgi:hypothetical protein